MMYPFDCEDMDILCRGFLDERVYLYRMLLRADAMDEISIRDDIFQKVLQI